MTLTPTTAPVAGPGGSYDDDAPTYVPPTTPGAIPRNRLKWLRPQDAVGRVLGVNAGPAANPTADWAQIEASFFTQLRLWQRHQLSRDGALYILSTHVFSRTWFLARYRPPSPQLVKRLDSAAVKYFWKRSLGDSGAGMALAAFRVGHRVKRSMLAMDHQLGGVLWFRTEHILCAVHAGMVITWMAPIAPNMRMGEARWQTTGHVAICAALGSLAGLIVHPDIKTAARRAHKGRRIPMHWLTYLCAWADIREHYERVLNVRLCVGQRSAL